ncbi:MAG TPA: dienelactone hydrolase family protein, partial [Tepidisphaeraceae bacterium]|nr:dienelactone hydrolase family protein [Tepidisphaeraceae bacterium]
MKYALLALAAAMITSSSVRGAIHTETVKYKAGSIEAEGFLAYDDSKPGKRPGIVVVPEWWGMTDYPKHRAQQLAELGYVAFAADMYGNGMTTDDPNQAGQWSGALRNGDRKELRARVMAALDQLKSNPRVDASKTAAIGYCFGGTTVLELARMGADVRGVVSFHGGLSTQSPAEAGKVKAKVLACHGADDKFESPEEVAAFQDELRKAKVDWQFNIYCNAVHAFTN